MLHICNNIVNQLYVYKKERKQENLESDNPAEALVGILPNLDEEGVPKIVKTGGTWPEGYPSIGLAYSNTLDGLFPLD